MTTTILDRETYLEALHRRYAEEAAIENGINIIELAKEAGFGQPYIGAMQHELKRFAALITAQLMSESSSICAEPVKHEVHQEPVAVVHNTDTPSNWSIIKPGLPAGTELYAAPVDANAIIEELEITKRCLFQMQEAAKAIREAARAEALKESAKVCDAYESRLEGMRDEDYQCELAGRQIGAARCAAAIRNLK